MKARLSNQNYFKSRNGYGMNAVLWVHDIKTALIHDAGNGGATNFDIINQSAFNAFESEIEKMPPVFIPDLGMELKMSTELFIGVLDDASTNRKKGH